MTPEAIATYLVQREQARADKDYAKADAICDQLAEEVVLIKGTGGKTIWHFP